MMIEKRDINETTTWNEIFRAMKLFNHPVCARADRARGVSRKIETSSRRDSRRAPCEAPGLPPLPPPPLLPPPPPPGPRDRPFRLSFRGEGPTMEVRRAAHTPRDARIIEPFLGAEQETFTSSSTSSVHFFGLLLLLLLLDIPLSLSLPSLLSCVKCKNLER